MKFGVLCFVVAAVGNARSILSPAGENVCMVYEKYVDYIQVWKREPVTVKKIEWCWRIPPRCNVETQTYQTVLDIKKIPRVRIVPKCCNGYEEVVAESKCVPVCSEPCLNGDCTQPEICSCESGFHGDRCEKPCASGTWGRGCLEKCECSNNATCDAVHGDCTCTSGWMGIGCDLPCETGYYGTNCESRCDCEGGLCNAVSGECEVINETGDANEVPDETVVNKTSTDETDSDDIIDGISETTLSESTTDPIDATNLTENTSTDGDLTSILPEESLNDNKGNETNDYDEIEHYQVNEIEHSQDFVEKRKFNLVNLLENFSIICGVFVLIFVVTMGSVIIGHYRKIRKIGIEFRRNNKNSNSQSFAIYRFYGGTVLPDKTILDNISTTNLDVRVEKPKMMTFKPLPDEKSKEYFNKTGIHEDR